MAVEGLDEKGEKKLSNNACLACERAGLCTPQFHTLTISRNSPMARTPPNKPRTTTVNIWGGRHGIKHTTLHLVTTIVCDSSRAIFRFCASLKSHTDSFCVRFVRVPSATSSPTLLDSRPPN